METIRLYPGSDAVMISDSRITRNFFFEDKPKFISYFGGFNDPFYANWLDIIEVCEGINSNSINLDNQVLLKNAVKAADKNCRQKYKDMQFYAGKAYNQDPKILNLFGKNNYKSDSRNKPKFIIFMKELYKVADARRDDLIAGGNGTTAPSIDEIETFANVLEAAHTSHQNFKKGRPTLTDKHIEKLNECYTFRKDVNAAAKNISFDTPNRVGVYTQTKSSSTKSSFRRQIAFSKSTWLITLNPETDLSVEFFNTSDIGGPVLNVCTLNVQNGSCVIPMSNQVSVGGSVTILVNTLMPGMFELTVSNFDPIMKTVKFKVKINRK